MEVSDILNKYNKKIATPRAQPVFLLLDVSYSMTDYHKIDELNSAVQTMLNSFMDNDELDHVKVTIITFGGTADVLVQNQRPAEILRSWTNLTARGGTPLGQALTLAQKLIEDRNVVPSKSFAPLVALMSDGQPTDEWEIPLNKFIDVNTRTHKCLRMSMALGCDADEDILRRFIIGSKFEGKDIDLFYAEDASKIKNFFDNIVMTVTRTSQMANKNSDVGEASQTVQAGDAAANSSQFNTRLATSSSQLSKSKTAEQEKKAASGLDGFESF